MTTAIHDTALAQAQDSRGAEPSLLRRMARGLRRFVRRSWVSAFWGLIAAAIVVAIRAGSLGTAIDAADADLPAGTGSAPLICASSYSRAEIDLPLAGCAEPAQTRNARSSVAMTSFRSAAPAGMGDLTRKTAIA